MEKTVNSKSLIYRFFASEKIEKFFFSALLATIFTAGLCFNMLTLSYKYLESQAGKSFYVDFNWVFWSGMIIVLFYLVRDYGISKRAVQFDAALVVLIQTMIFVGIIGFHNEDYSNVAFTWILPIAYIAGKVAVGKEIDEANRRIIIIVYTFMIALFIASMLDFYTFFKYSKLYGYYLTEGWPGFWSDAMQNRCGMSLGLFFINTSIWFAVMRRKKNPIALGIMIILLIVSQYWGIMVQSRTITLLPVLSFFVVALIWSYERRKSIPKAFWLGIIAIVVLIALFVALTFANNWFDIRTIYKTSQWGEELFENQRIRMGRNGFRLMLQNPYGKIEPPVSKWDNPHDTFLQYGRVNGIAVFILIEIYRLITLKDVVVMSAKKGNKYDIIKYLLVPAFVCLNFNFTIDPNGYVQRELLMMLLLVNGIIRGWNELHET